jgi:disulfide bond formation protein DsbB
MWRRGMLGIAAACVVAVGAALVGQYGFDMQPCPWCILQRLIYLSLALVCIVAALVDGRGPRRALGGLALVLAGCGVAASIWQHVVAAKQFSCNLTLADNIITALRLESLLPALFQVTATCADAEVSMFGVPFEYWSLVLFVLLGAAIVRLTLQPSATR